MDGAEFRPGDVQCLGVGGTGAGIGSPYDLDTFVLNSSAIPEFSLVLVPVVGMLGAVFVIYRLSKKKGRN